MADRANTPASTGTYRGKALGAYGRLARQNGRTSFARIEIVHRLRQRLLRCIGLGNQVFR